MSVSAQQAVALLDLLAPVPLVVDGGWGVDALLGERTREHDDLDLVVDAGDLADVRSALGRVGFAVERDLLPTALALRHPDGRSVDLHVVEGGEQVLEDGSRWPYGEPATGTIGGREVRCCSVETQVRAHLGYEPDEDDRADLRRLADRFGVALPPPYA